jgi:hypothetical protein
MANQNELPRKEAVRAVVTVLNHYRKWLPAQYNGQHREVANEIVDRCEAITCETKYKTRFLVTEFQVKALVKHDVIAVLDLVDLGLHIGSFIKKDVGPRNWAPIVGSFKWERV